MIIQYSDKVVATVYRCGVCKKLFVRNVKMIVCAVNHHSGGACCHYSDNPLTENQGERIVAILNEDAQKA